MKTAILSLLLVGAAFAEPFVPASKDAVVVRVPRGLKPVVKTRDLGKACADARHYIELCRATGDQRYIGYAEGVLASWINLKEPPGDVLYLRATLRQSRHDFEASLRDLDKILAKDPRDRGAVLTKIAVLQAQGRIEEARAECQRAPWLASDLTGIATIASVASMSGQAEASFNLLKRALPENSTNGWAWTTLAEIAVRAGRKSDAAEAFKKALGVTTNDAYLQRVYAEFKATAQ